MAYIADQDVDGVLELYDTTVASPGVTAKLNGPLTAGGNICNFTFSPDSQRVAYCADQDTDEVTELFTVALASPGASTKLSPALVSGGNVHAGYQFSADSSFMLYLADQQVDERIELFRVDIAAPGVTTKMNGTLVTDGDVWDFKFRPDGTHAAYIATQDDFTVYELYEVAFATPAASTKLSAPMTGGGLWQFEYAEDSASATYSAEQDSTEPELYRVGVASPGSATKLNSPIASRRRRVGVHRQGGRDHDAVVPAGGIAPEGRHGRPLSCGSGFSPTLSASRTSRDTPAASTRLHAERPDASSPPCRSHRAALSASLSSSKFPGSGVLHRCAAARRTRPA